MTNPNKISQIVDDSVFMAGGDQVQFPGYPILRQAGLVVTHKLESFQRELARNNCPIGHKVKSRARIPSLAVSKKDDVVTWLQDLKNVGEPG